MAFLFVGHHASCHAIILYYINKCSVVLKDSTPSLNGDIIVSISQVATTTHW
jgi:hypothetical protein